MADRHVAPHPGGGWQITKPDHKQASEVKPTQAEATDRAREIIARDGGGELVVHATDGQVRRKNTIAPATDPSPPPG